MSAPKSISVSRNYKPDADASTRALATLLKSNARAHEKGLAAREPEPINPHAQEVSSNDIRA